MKGKKPLIYFELPADVFIAKWYDQLIMLNIQENSFWILQGESAKYLNYILAQAFTKENGHYCPADNGEPTFICDTFTIATLNQYINYFSENMTVCLAYNFFRKNNIAYAANPIGLTPNSIKKSLPNSRISPIIFIEIFVAISLVNILLKFRGLKGLIAFINRRISVQECLKSCGAPSNNMIEALSLAIESTNIFFFKKNLCLQNAFALALVLLRRNYSFVLKVGVQAIPFFSHAWVEHNGKIVRDDVELSKRLAPIFQISFTKT